MKTRNRRIKNYKEGGITLIALVVMVIILLILAGVMVSLVVGQNGLLQRAQTASNTMANATANELTQIGQYDGDVETYTKDFIAEKIPKIPAGNYIPGDQVMFGKEQFFVLGDDGESVRLLAKYCLSKTANIQLDKNGDPNTWGMQSFSKTEYWSNIPNLKNSYDLQSGEELAKLTDQSEEDSSNNAILKA